jgi:5'-phosphate synthase pdxT subunit
MSLLAAAVHFSLDRASGRAFGLPTRGWVPIVVGAGLGSAFFVLGLCGRGTAVTLESVEKPLRIGVLAVQGNFREHAAMLRRLGAEAVEVRLPEQLDGLDGLIVPGGESTTITRLMELYDLDDALRTFEAPVFGTCAGMIVLDRDHLGLADIAVRRNAFGRQVHSFEADLDIGHGDEPVRAVFIRAPWIEEAGPEVEVLAEVDGHPVLARQGRILVAAFHPELTDDTRIHELFLNQVREAMSVRA